MRARVTFLIRDLGYGGAQRQMVALAAQLERDEFDPTVVHFYGGPLEAVLRDAGVATRCVGKRHRWDLASFLPRLLRIVRASRPQLICGYLAESNLLCALMKPFLDGARVIWSLRDSQSDAPLWGILGRLSFRLCRRLSPHADRIIVNSRAGRAYYASLGYPADRLDVVPNGIDADRFRPDPSAGTLLRSRLGRADGGLLIGHVGRINPMKDHPTFLRAAALVLREHPEATFLCVGGGDPARADELRALAASLGVAGRLLWSPPRDDMPALYNALDFLVSSSAFGEGFPNVVGEAMACGVPCVVTDVGDCASLVAGTGLAVPPGRPDLLAAAMLRVVRLDAGERARMSAEARERIKDQFSLPRMVRRTTDLLRELLPRSGSVTAPVRLETAR